MQPQSKTSILAKFAMHHISGEFQTEDKDRALLVEGVGETSSLQDVKERILEHMAVSFLKGAEKGEGKRPWRWFVSWVNVQCLP